MSDSIFLNYIKRETHNYVDYNGYSHKELIIEYAHNGSITTHYTKHFVNPFFIVVNSNTLKIRIPIFEGTFYYYLPNYKEYYYLPYEEKCIPKIIAAGIDQSEKVNATKENCYIKTDGYFVPFLKDNSFKTYKKTYTDKKSYVNLSDLESKEALEQYCSVLLDKIFNLVS